jgi:hypothetical protein
MTNVLADAAAWLAGAQKLHLATTIAWSRGSQSATVAARIGRTTWDVESADGRVERMESRDFIVDPADLPVHPQEGDEVSETYGTTVAKYAVMAPSGTPAVHWADAHRTSLRMHTKLVGKESA